MGLGGDAWPIACHLLVLAVLVLVGLRVLRLFAHPEVLAEAERRGLSAAAALACCALALERSWGIFARIMRAHGVDVYGLHPAPELVALLTAGSLYGVGAVLVVAQRGPQAGGRRIVWESVALLLLWGMLAMGLT